MGLTSLWSTITAPRVKEINPKTKWLDKRRPISSPASTRTAKKAKLRRLQSDFLIDARPNTSKSEKKQSDSKPLSLNVTKPIPKDEAISQDEHVPSPTQEAEQGLEILALPSTFSPGGKHLVEFKTSEDVARPGTAVTSDEPLSTGIAELPANEVSSPPLSSPLPSPAPLQHKFDPISEVVGWRKRSNSSGSSKPRVKRASWIQNSKRKAVELDLPPPLPPPTGPPPAIPDVKSLTAEPPAIARRKSWRPSFKRSMSTSSDAPRKSSLTVTKNSLDSDSILEAFPSVPCLIRSKTIASKPSQSEPELAKVTSFATSPDGNPANSQNLRQSIRFSTRDLRVAARINAIDSLVMKGAPAAPLTPKRDSKQLPPVPAESDDRRSMSFSEELEREYDKVTVMIENMDHKAVDPASTARWFDVGMDKIAQPTKFSNEEALAALEFGLSSDSASTSVLDLEP